MTHHRNRAHVRSVPALALILLALAGCNQQDAASGDGGERAVAAPTPGAGANTAANIAEAASPAPVATGSAAPIALVGLGEGDVRDAKLTGELACSFGAAGKPPLLFARGDVGSSDPAIGLVKQRGAVELLRAPGGFNGMVKGTTFAGKGGQVQIAITGKAQGGGESPPMPARLTYTRFDGAQSMIEGDWTCGP